ncbi:MAG: chemotaxis protein CheA [Candidatus Kapabacteria bacterium]|nr:chemotaxis protein CheA [Candidatus Kapabacteria bacterium]
MTNFNDPEMQEIYESFLIETHELLDSLSQDLMTIESNPDDKELLNRIFRSFHTIKGTSSFMGFTQISGITHHAEDILNKARRGEMIITLKIIDVLLEVHDWIERIMEAIENEADLNFDYSETLKKIDEIQIKKSDTTVINETVQDVNDNIIKEDIKEDIKESGKENLTQKFGVCVDKVLKNADKFLDTDDFTPEELEMIEAAFNEVNANFKNEKIVKEFPRDSSLIATKAPIFADNPSQIKTSDSDDDDHGLDQKSNKESTSNIGTQSQKGQVGKKPSADSIRVDVSRVEALMDLSGELVLGRNRLAQITDQLAQIIPDKERLRDLIETTAQVDFVTSEIQAAVMKMRMVPIGKLYQKAPRIVRDLSKEFGKNINLIVKGEETEIDRGIIEELNDPLVHMIRNSCDHGIESPEERAKIGKDTIGKITLDAEQEGNNIVLRISDDGKGMDPEKLKAKAIEKGILTVEQAAQMSQREVFQLIFMPGFSMAAKVSSVSGRGVGMDVVRTNIQNLKGVIEIESEIGKGSTFVIKLPLTLAIIQGLLIRVKNETYALPLSSVVEVVAIDINLINTVNKQEVIRIRKEVLPIIRLDKSLGVKDAIETLEGRNVVVVGLGLQRIGLVVDELLGQQEIVIKSLGEYLGVIKGIAGSTILGDGRVIMIVDVTEIVENLYAESLKKFK